MFRRVVLVKTDVSKELRASIIREEMISSSETSVIIRATGRSIPEDVIIYVESVVQSATFCSRFKTLFSLTGTAIFVRE
jgi:hypothetical protein